jgi:hypothetical protein
VKSITVAEMKARWPQLDVRLNPYDRSIAYDPAADRLRAVAFNHVRGRNVPARKRGTFLIDEPTSPFRFIPERLTKFDIVGGALPGGVFFVRECEDGRTNGERAVFAGWYDPSADSAYRRVVVMSEPADAEPPGDVVPFFLRPATYFKPE